ncbi:unnamed protein product [Phytophthora lilii]|uniref:Unnamed protein product n=1 Tax=Phytophthora lilii TaxID=2077276 RepID=A0A9W6WYU9_9STRA|nr:unnamed protein product [Phytophthora lilii]
MHLSPTMPHTPSKSSTPLDTMANLAQHLARLQLGAAGARHRPPRRLNDEPPTIVNALSVSGQRSSVRRALLASLNCPARRVLTLGEGPELPSSGQSRGFLPSGPVFQVAFANKSRLLAAVDEEGAVGIVDADAGRRKSRWMGHHNAVFDVIWTRDDAQVATAAGDLEIRIWDVETAGRSAMTATTPVSTLRGHDMSVKCVRQAPGNAHVFASGGRDGKVLLWDTRATGKPVSTLENVHAEPTTSRTSSPNVSLTSPTQKRRRRVSTAATTSSSPRSVTCVEFGVSDHEVITAGSVDAVVKFWDIRRLGTGSSGGRGKKKAAVKVPSPIREISCSSREGSRRGISSLALRRGGASHLLVNVLNDGIAVIDVGKRHHHTGYHEARTILRCSGHKSSSFYSKATFSPDGDFIAGASADGIVYIWDARVSTSYDGVLSSTWSGFGVPQRAPCFALKDHTNEVNGVAWSPLDFSQLASCSDDGTVRCWQVGGKQDQRLEHQKDSNGAKPFQLDLALDSSSAEAGDKTEWANWNAFLEQPDGYAYHVRGIKTAQAPRVNHPSSPRRHRAPLADKQGASPQVTRHNTEPRLHPVHEIPTATLQLQQEPHESQKTQPQQKRRIKLRRKTQTTMQPKRAQRTLLELWGR